MPRVFRNFASLSLSTAIRLATAFALFVLLAREWGAAKFGEFMYLFAIAALLVQACEYGFSQQILREVGRSPEAVAGRMGEYLSAKVWLTAVTWVAAIAFVLLSGLTIHQASTLALLLCAGTLMSYSDFLIASFRALGHFANETWVTLSGNILYFTLGMVAIYAGWGALGLAAAFVVGRICHLGITVRAFRRHVHEPILPCFHLARVLPVIRGGAAYGLSVALTTAFVNLDTVFISNLLGFESAGTYQAAARFYQGAVLLPPIFAGIFLPRMSHLVDQPAVFLRLAKQLSWVMLFAGSVMVAAFFAAAHVYQWVYPDPSLALVKSLLPWFGLLALIHFVAAAHGITVTAMGGQAYRALATLIALVLMAASSFPLLKAFGPTGMIFALCLAYTFLFVAYAAWSSHRGVVTGNVLASVAAIAVVVAVMLTANVA